jgi:hypothetical protein
MHLTQGTFSFLPPLTREQIAAQVQYCLDQGWAVSIEYTDDPHPRNVYWEMFGHPMFDITDAEGVMVEVDRAQKNSPATTSRSTPSMPPTAGRRSACHSSSGVRSTSRASAWCARRSMAATSATPPKPTPPLIRLTHATDAVPECHE